VVDGTYIPKGVRCSFLSFSSICLSIG
jgi:hypothetical protein